MTETDQSCTTYTFAELSEKAKNKAREAYTSDGYLDYDWWDGIYEDFEQVCTILNINISTHSVILHNGKTRQDPDIFFSGFYSQGDGAWFKGTYLGICDASTEIRQHCDDEELWRIVDQLAAMQTTQRLLGLEFFTASIDVSNHDNLRTEIHDWGNDEIGEPDEEQFHQLMLDLAAWLYKQLEAENDWLYSDECVDQYLVDETFDRTGAII